MFKRKRSPIKDELSELSSSLILEPGCHPLRVYFSLLSSYFLIEPPGTSFLWLFWLMTFLRLLVGFGCYFLGGLWWGPLSVMSMFYSQLYRFLYRKILLREREDP